MKPELAARGEAAKPAGWWTSRASPGWPALALALLLAAQFTMVFTRAVNWDEFWFYYHVDEFAKGRLAEPLQSLHVRLFAWLPALSGSSVTKVVIARLTMFACELATLAAIYRIARRFAPQAEALICALLYVSAGYVLQHGFSFRTDPMITAALMWSMAILVKERLGWWQLGAAAFLLAIALMISIKIVLYLPAFAGIAWLRWREDGGGWRVPVSLTAMLIATLAFASGIYLWHSQALSGEATPAGMAGSAARWMFFLGVPPYWAMIVKSAMFSPILLILAIMTPFLLFRSQRPTRERIALAGLWVIVLTPAFYTNTAGYFYVFMLAPVAAGCALAVCRATQRYHAMGVSIAILAVGMGIFALEDRSTIARQYALVDVMERTFPEGTAYFDHNGMVPHLQKANYLMTPSAVSNYRASGRNSFREAMEQRPVPVVLGNWPHMIDTLEGKDDTLLLPGDLAAWRENYIAFWGPIFIAGKLLDAGETRDDEEFLVPGRYSVLDAPVVMDGRAFQPGDVLQIERGFHDLHAPRGAARLQWGERLAPPVEDYKDEPIYVGF